MNSEIESINSYMQSISCYSLISQSEEIELAAKIKQGCKESREKLILSNLRLVVKIAHEYKGLGLPLVDLVAEGNVGLIKASEKFDPEKGAKFSTYAAWWIKQAMRRSMSSQIRTVRIPVHSAHKMQQIRKAKIELTCRLKREPSDEELASHLDYTVRTIKTLSGACSSTLSLQTKLGSEKNLEVQDLIADQNSDCAPEIVETAESLCELKKHMNLLTDREKLVLNLRFGFFSTTSKTLEEVSKAIDKTRERVRQIQNEALKKLRKKMIEEHLRG